VPSKLLYLGPRAEVPAPHDAVEAGSDHQRLQGMPGHARDGVGVDRRRASLTEDVQVKDEELAIYSSGGSQGQVA